MLTDYSSFSSVMPFSCQSSAIVKNFLPCLLCSKPLQAMYTVKVLIHVRPYTQLQFSLCISCCLKCRISTKMFVFVQEQEVLQYFVSWQPPSVDKICSRYQLSPQTLTTVGYGASNSAVQGSFLSSIRDSVFCLSVSWGQLQILFGDNVVGFGR